MEINWIIRALVCLFCIILRTSGIIGKGDKSKNMQDWPKSLWFSVSLAYFRNVNVFTMSVLILKETKLNPNSENTKIYCFKGGGGNWNDPTSNCMHTCQTLVAVTLRRHNGAHVNMHFSCECLLLNAQDSIFLEPGTVKCMFWKWLAFVVGSLRIISDCRNKFDLNNNVRLARHVKHVLLWFYEEKRLV